MTSPEIRAAIANGARTVVVPCGAVEQHGPHLPLSVDADHAGELAVRLAERLDALVAPTIEVGCSEHHMSFPGTLSIRPSTLAAVYTDLCMSLARHGFTRLLIFSAHMGNYEALADMEDALIAKVPPGVDVVVFTDRALLLDTWRSVTDQYCGGGELVGGHADIAETSIMMAIDGASIRESSIAPGWVGAPTPQSLARVFAEGVQALSGNGVLGDPRGASVELGELCIDAVADILEERFRDPAWPDRRIGRQ